ncbi:hypothetical protein CLTEP_26570 [Clostridium tepidiprofundi DSM 19306]|uniref:Reverse transcriptase (RNA-dependent DNA polymerase) n=1 Tax=Clostridium tepidiprofundi DSM 19306 TaxID=1121338 RepID=A0A151AS19_9CLOT|nr:hypothetical protein [Clostridium tepidiprofundi]KYH30444.1 hypothetical protein CLTEP_26570 [Clostridium tepidiprofundi DSM 19306]
MKLNNLYNFKNPVKNFLDIDEIKLPDNISSFDLEKLCWVKPFNFRVRKQEDKYRTLKMPNILNFARAYEEFKNMPHFSSIQSMDYSHKRLSANIETGDFASGEYDRQLEEDFERLCIYDNLIKMDIKEYYGRIYTHKIIPPEHNDRFLSNMNLGATNGLIMGNYLSLYFAEVNLTSISNDIEKEIEDSGIQCEFSYFSDDFYFFCNENDNEKIVKIFDKVLEKYELERNDTKKEIWTYETFNNYNLVARYWKKVIAHCNVRFDGERNNNKLYFINQIVYRISNLQDNKLKKTFINNFFKTKYFRELNLDKYQVKNYDYHQLCFIFKFSPEAMLYAIDRFSIMNDFDKNRLHKFFKVRYKEILQEPFNDEQLYFYYAIKILNFTDLLIEQKDAVLKSNNQILISYYLKDGLFGSVDIDKLKANDDEKYWFQNYHLILYSPDLLADLENSIDMYLIPINAKEQENDKPSKKTKKACQKKSYMDFYKENLGLKNSIIRDIPDVHAEIEDYLRLKIEENEATFEEEDLNI